jgi:hypothetical protein
MKVTNVTFRLAKVLSATAMCALLFAHTSYTNAGPREQAKRMHDRIAGVPPSAVVLDEMTSDIQDGNLIDAAFIAMENRAFYDVTLKNLAAPWTNEEFSSFVPLNDYTATVIGLVRDNADFRTLLYGDVLYEGASSLGLPAYSNSNNNHYQALETGGYSLKDNLVAVAQSSRNGLPSSATAGIMTSRAAARAFFKAGTNRSMFRFTLLNHLCNDMEQLNDTSLTTDRIRQDVSRSPGGDSRIYLNGCMGCHNGMDPMAQSMAYYDYDYDPVNDPDGEDGQLSFNTAGTTDPDTGTRVKGKYLINASNFEYGYVTLDDEWDNYWRSGQNSFLGWDESLPGNGYGLKSMGQELAHTQAFAQCQVKNVFKNVCLRSPVDSADRSQIDSMVSSFQANNHNLKQVFAESAVYCRGE